MGNILNEIGVSAVNALTEVVGVVIGFIPRFFAALVALIIMWVIAIAVGRLVTQILRAFRIDQAIEKVGGKEGIEKAGYKLDVADLIGDLIKWIVIVAAILTAANILELNSVSGFLNEVLLYVPNIVVAVVILLIGVLAGSFLSKVVRGSVKVAGFARGDLLAAVTRWTIFIFALLVAMDQLGIASNIIGTLVTGFVAMLALAGGLAFGLGGKEHAATLLKELKEEISESK